MKKLALVVFLGLGLLRAEVVESAKTESIESVCGNVDMGSIYLSNEVHSKHIARFFYKVDSNDDKDKFEKQYLSSEDKIYKLNGLVLSLLGAKTYYTEIKRSDKESVCAYKLVFDYLNTQLTEQDLERFERFMAEHNAYDWFNNDDDNKKYILSALKFIKYHNKIDELVYKKNYRETTIFALKELGENLFNITEWGDMRIVKMIYGKVQRGYVYREIGGYVRVSTKALKLEEEIGWYGTDKDKKELESILKWAESIK